MTFFEPTDTAALTHAFPNLPFALKHHFVGNPLLTLPMLAELVRELPRDRLEYNSGKAAISQKPETTPTVDLEPEEIVRNIETAGAWMVLKSVEQDPAYRKLIEDALMEVARTRGYRQPEGRGLRGYPRLHLRVVGAIRPRRSMPTPTRISSSRSTATSSSMSTTTATARSPRKRRWKPARSSIATCPTKPKFDAKCTTYKLKPGDGVFVPYQWPHWVRTAGSYSISLSLTWKSDAGAPPERYLRGQFDAARLRHAAEPARRESGARCRQARACSAPHRPRSTPLRRNESMRRTIRRLVKGRDANYYLSRGRRRRGRQGILIGSNGRKR